MTASEARSIIEQNKAKDSVKKFFDKIKEAAENNINYINVCKNGITSHELAILRKNGFSIDSEYNNDYEMRVESYTISW